MIDISTKFSVHIMHTKPAETDDFILMASRALHEVPGVQVQHTRQGLPARQGLAS
jgi:hypothetical protein